MVINSYDHYAFEFEAKTNVEAFNAQICPELTYCILPKLAFSLGLGGIEYAIVDWGKANSSWMINFHPNIWRFGTKVVL